MKIAIMEEFTRIGGGQTIAATISGILSESGNSVDLYTDKNHFFLSGKYSNIFKSNFSFNENMRAPTIFLKAIMFKKKLSKIKGYDFIINNHPNIFLYKGDLNMMHTVSLVESVLDEKGDIEKPALLKFIGYSGIYEIYNKSDFWVPGNYNKTVSERVFRALGISSIRYHVIPLPVKIPEQVDISNKKRDQVLIFGRINVEKKLDLALEMAKKCNLRFVIAGALNPGNEGYYKHLISNAPENVSIVKNPDESTKHKLFSESGIFLHLRRRENFPISVLEGIAYGCIPVVPKYGGTWEDIVSKGDYGIGYESVEDGAEQLLMASGSSSEYRKTIFESRIRFSEKKFSEKLQTSISDIIENKKR